MDVSAYLAYFQERQNRWRFFLGIGALIAFGLLCWWFIARVIGKNFTQGGEFKDENKPHTEGGGTANGDVWKDAPQTTDTNISQNLKYLADQLHVKNQKSYGFMCTDVGKENERCDLYKKLLDLNGSEQKTIAVYYNNAHGSLYAAVKETTCDCEWFWQAENMTRRSVLNRLSQLGFGS